jgi:hypothetical protein
MNTLIKITQIQKSDIKQFPFFFFFFFFFFLKKDSRFDETFFLMQPSVSDIQRERTG